MNYVAKKTKLLFKGYNSKFNLPDFILQTKNYPNHMVTMEKNDQWKRLNNPKLIQYRVKLEIIQQ